MSTNDPCPLSWRWFLRNEGVTLYVDPLGNLRAREPVPAGELRTFISANRAAIVEEVLQSTRDS